jgi:putative membrane protein insertion efficiency factor
MKNTLKKIAVFIALLPVRIYQYSISPFFPATCRHEPTCSNYMVQAINEWGVFKGFWLGIKRIGKCHPWGTFGPDPVPKNQDKKI